MEKRNIIDEGRTPGFDKQAEDGVDIVDHATGMFAKASEAAKVAEEDEES